MPRWLFPVVLTTPPFSMRKIPLPPLPMKNDPPPVKLEPGSRTITEPLPPLLKPTWA